MFALFRNAISRKTCDLNWTRRLKTDFPFADDLTSIDYDDYNLEDFLHYRPDNTDSKPRQEDPPNPFGDEFLNAVVAKEPIVFVSKMKDPHWNLAIEDFIYNQMPLPSDNAANYNRLFLYSNSPCVVIGKNQNPWKEVNLPLLQSLRIPLVRRRSGGGTVVHDLGNTNFSFMTSKANFDRQKFSSKLVEVLNDSKLLKFNLQVNERGDIISLPDADGMTYKVSGSAYKLSKGRSYHHATMLLNSRLDVLKKLLSRDEKKLGVVDAKASVESVRSKVKNLDIPSDDFIRLAIKGFREEYGTISDTTAYSSETLNKTNDGNETSIEYDQDELFNLKDFMVSTPAERSVRVMYIDGSKPLPTEIKSTYEELKNWNWKFGATPKFTHYFTNEEIGIHVQIEVGKHAEVKDVIVNVLDNCQLSHESVLDSFRFLQQVLRTEPIKYTGSTVAGYITNDQISDWLGFSIDNTV
ncbi:Piso0_000802 [Millerozyma farinosa CBS 7064]|uniref:Putative lipoate-protein ligase A n=1 Tax=Pichia sorbitophila (strain ATCC MYA-4447 / BCRC 22081 / CBS 7064 / NBRC 10061 / NRRL Y-12695) TaxID=559304 RepID=G8YRJ8_PICSO|nr:Piso0_000802 [Millerozyma farinosa CBS 7064]